MELELELELELIGIESDQQDICEFFDMNAAYRIVDVLRTVLRREGEGEGEGEGECDEQGGDQDG